MPLRVSQSTYPFNLMQESSAAQAKAALWHVAQLLGFSAMGVADPYAPQGDTLADWLAFGAHADMQWMERHLAARLDPSLVLEGVRSVIMFSYEYSREDAGCQLGRIARYAQGVDYHQVLKPKLADLDECLQIYGGKQRGFSDSGPISERFFAQQAGLGWIGKNGLLIRTRRGSYCVLASLLSTLELPRDEPLASRCGNCTRCIDNCPTGALNGQSCDARRCLSYWNIESKSMPPPDIREAMGDRVFGCDCCQEVCPWNQKIRDSLSIDTHMLMPASLQRLTAEQLHGMREEEFLSLCAKSPLRRAGLERLKFLTSNKK